jgi:hypothetical protein
VDRIRQGRDPEWRLVFDDRLDNAARDRIRRAVRAASAVADPDEAAVAAGFARREQRRVWFLGLIVLPLQLAMALVYVVSFLAGTLRLPAAVGWFWVAVLLVLVGAVPVALRRRYQRARRAADANERIARRLP